MVLAAGFVAAVYLLKPRLHQAIKQRAEAYLQTQFGSSIQFSEFHVALFPRIRMTIQGVVMRHHGRTDIPPLIEVRTITVDANPAAFWGPQHEISRVRLDGLQIHTPPAVPDGAGAPLIHGTHTDLARKYPFVIDETDADNALIVLLRKPGDSDRPPNEFEIHQLVLHGFGFDRAAAFHAVLTNPRPKGEIVCDGKFGPWNADVPSQTPVSGNYNFRNADLATFQGLKGILSSIGSFSGLLDYLTVTGVTDTPDFALRTSDHPMALHTDFSAIVDGTNGNTILNNVTAAFRHTVLQVHGSVVDKYPQVKGRTIVLDATSLRARVEDLLALTVNSDRPVMTGAAQLKTRILIPEGTGDLVDRLHLDGQFALTDARFTSSTAQQKVDTLSRKGQGKPNDIDITDAASDFQGRFALSQAEVSFSNLEFKVQGASVSLRGVYDLDNGQLDFRGQLHMDAKLSQTMTGWKSALLKPFDHFFHGQDGGSRIPIKITGSRQNPTFATDFRDKNNPKSTPGGNSPSRD